MSTPTKLEIFWRNIDGSRRYRRAVQRQPRFIATTELETRISSPLLLDENDCRRPYIDWDEVWKECNKERRGNEIIMKKRIANLEKTLEEVGDDASGIFRANAKLQKRVEYLEASIRAHKSSYLEGEDPLIMNPKLWAALK